MRPRRTGRMGRGPAPALIIRLAFPLVLVAMAVPAAVAQPETPMTGRAVGMTSPHPAPEPGGVPEKSETVMQVTTRVLCMCGGCVNQTLHECTCGMAADEREKVASKIAGGQTPEQIIKAYVDEFGPQILSTPEKSGFNLVGWLVPFVVAIVLLASLTVVLRGWVKPEAIGPIPSLTSKATSGDAAEARYRERLERELKEHEG